MRVIMKDGGKLRSYPVAANAVGAIGDLLMLDSAGYLAPAAAAAGNKGCVGLCFAPFDNTGGANGAFEAQAEEGVVTMSGAGFVAGDVGTTAYAATSTTAQPAPGTNLPILGPIERFRSATSVDAQVGLSAARLAVS